MLNVAEFRGLLKTKARDIPTGLYFHENQIAYPNRHNDPRDLHFAFTNLTSTLAADYVWFNSEYNRASLVSGLSEAARQWPDFAPYSEIETITAKSEVQAPGIHPPPEADNLSAERAGPIHLVWAARWEHDKNPDDLLHVLRALQQRQLAFRISIIGQSFRQQPAAFDAIRREFQDKILHWGFQSSRESYWRVLSQADLFLSTAIHEFYGLSVIEGLAAGLVAVLPNRLAYPEIAQRLANSSAEVVLYDDLDQCVQQVSSCSERLPEIRAGRGPRRAIPEITETTWPSRSAQLDRALARSVKSISRQSP
jgi:glycosyltransferase involved in cell wall biosynthesis